MKNYIVLSLIAAAVLSGCSNDFEVSAPWKEVPVVYTILSAKDTANYIRIEKAFLDPERGVLEIAQIADSLYYPANAISVFLERVSNGSRQMLTRVDGNLEGYVRNNGIFASSPNWLYKLKGANGSGVLPGETYRLIIERNDNKPDITASTTIPGDFTFVTPNADEPFLTFPKDDAATLTWRADVNSTTFNVYLTIRYRELRANGSLAYRDTLYWTAGLSVPRSNALSGGVYRTSFDMSTADFFQFLVENIPPAPDGHTRRFDACEILLEGGGKEIETYIETQKANSGITGSEILTAYTNLSEGFGLVTSKNSSTLVNVFIRNATVDAMNTEGATKALNFTY